MFGTMGISELIIILVIVLIIFGAGKLPQIGEGVGKALRGFKKEVNDIPPPDAAPPKRINPHPCKLTLRPKLPRRRRSRRDRPLPFIFLQRPIPLGRN